jgi:hypothetical protein
VISQEDIDRIKEDQGDEFNNNCSWLLAGVGKKGDELGIQHHRGVTQ